MIVLLAAMLSRFDTLPVGHLALWCGMVLLTAVLIVLVASRWGKSHPVTTCGVLSLLAHVLLACAATIVRLMNSAEQVAEGPPIRVRIVEADSPVVVDTPPTPELEHELQAVVNDELTAPDLMPAVERPSTTPAETPSRDPDPTPTRTGSETDNAASSPSPPTASLPPPPEVDLAEPDAQRSESPPQPQPIEPTEVVTAPIADADNGPAEPPVELPGLADDMAQVQSTWANSVNDVPQYVAMPPAAPTPYSHRHRSDRLGFVERQGGSRETEAAVRAALAWLAAAQSHDGRWDASRFSAGQEHSVLGHNRGGAGRNADCGVSGLALLAFLGAGYTHQAGEYRDTIDHGLRFLASQQAADGNLGGEATLYAHMYCHSMATFAFAEALAMSGDQRLRPVVERACAFSVTAQSPSAGGWRYQPGQSGDTSQLGWQMMALRSAELGGVPIPPRTWTSVERFLRSVTRGTAGGLACYRPDAPVSRSMTAEALYCRQLLSEAVGGRIEPAAGSEAAASILAELPGSGPANLYYWYYATLALHHQKDQSLEADHAWRTWNEAMKTTLLGLQVPHGSEAGSWSPNTVWGGYGGRIYSTAVAALCLEVYYRYAPTLEIGEWIATEPPGSEIRR